MPFNRKPQKFNAAIKSVVIGSGDKTVTLGGENVLPFYAFDGEIKNGPKVGVEITDLGMEGEPESVKAYYEGAATMGEIAKKAAAKWLGTSELIKEIVVPNKLVNFVIKG